MRIYTRTGDAGETSLFGAHRVSKADPRVDAYGEVDELNAWLGLVRASAPDPDVDAALLLVQRGLFAVGAQLADPAERLPGGLTKALVTDEDIARLEESIDRWETELPPLSHFILPGGCPAGAALHVARTVCRRAERRVVALAPSVDAVIIRYLNRLSDFLFVAARVANHRASLPESAW